MKNCVMALHALEIDVFLGWLDEERAQKQKVSVDIELLFATPPLGCMSDNLDDTICYDALVKKIKLLTSEKHFRLVEHLAREIYLLTKEEVTVDVDVKVKVKKKPVIENLMGGVSVVCGD
jgi:dihydroneopterin aldolase